MLTTSMKFQMATAVAALALVSTLVMRTSSAVFSGSTASAGSWDAGTVALTDDDGAIYGSASLTVAGLRPGSTGFDCIEVTYAGTVVGATDLAGVKLYASSVTNTDGLGGDTSLASGKLSDDLDVTVASLSAADYGLTNCATFTGGATLVSSTAVDGLATGYAGGYGSWVPAAQNEKRVYKVSWALGTDTANDAQGDGVDVTLTWEAQTV